jgi:pimeloyl-ACP methyl ester carboxylesterase
MHDVMEAADRIPHAEITVLPGSHFLPLEHPGLVHSALGELAKRCEV